MAEAAGTTRNADRSRFDSLYRTHHRDILAYFLRRMPRPDAEDATSEVFTVAWRRIEDVPAGGRSLEWLFGVAHNVLSNHRRGWRRAVRLGKRLAGLARAIAETPELQVVRSSEDEMLLTALARLRWSDREILKLATWEKLSYASIGNLLGVSEAAAGQRISRARKRLAAELARLERKTRFSVPLLRRKED